jgi:phytoene synthase
MDSAPFLASLPVEQRLALAYAPRRSRDLLLAVLALDARLASVVRSIREPLLAQARLAWWRDRLGSDPSAWPQGEPLLDLLRRCRIDARSLVGLVDGWEHLLAGEPLQAGDIEALVSARSVALVSAGETLVGRPVPGLNRVARCWALADLASRLSAPDERALARSLGAGEDWRGIALPRALRPVAVLGGLARRCRNELGLPLLAGPGSALTALRIGLFGV